MVCEKCGNELKEGGKFCTKCGSKVKVKLDKFFIPSVILMAVGIIGMIYIYFFLRFSFSWRNMWVFVSWSSLFFTSLVFFSGVTLAFISLYRKKHKTTMIAGIAACAVTLLIGLLLWIGVRSSSSWGLFLAEMAFGREPGGILFIIFSVFPIIGLQIINIMTILDIILLGAIILAFIFLHKKRHKIILIAGLAVIALFFIRMLIIPIYIVFFP